MSTPNTPGNDGGFAYEGHPSTTRLQQALDARFEGPDRIQELRDITKHGLSGGVGGFIYSSELADFFDEHESDIEDVLQEMDFPFSDLVEDEESWTFQGMKERAVWIVVEEYAHLRMAQASLQLA